MKSFHSTLRGKNFTLCKAFDPPSVIVVRHALNATSCEMTCPPPLGPPLPLGVTAAGQEDFGWRVAGRSRGSHTWESS